MATAVPGGGPVGVLALQGDFREHLEIFSQLGVAALPVRVPRELERISGLVIPGGESTTISFLLRSSGLAGPLRERLACGMPAFGTCAGMVLLGAEILDGRADQDCFGAIDISVRRNAFGRQRESFEADLEVEGLAVPMHAVFIRAPIVERAGPYVRALATIGTPAGPKPVICREGRVLVASFHPELVGDPRLHELFVAMLEEQLEEPLKGPAKNEEENVRAF